MTENSIRGIGLESGLCDQDPLLSKPSPIGRMRRVLDETDFAWSLSLIGEDQADKLAALTGDLRRRQSATGEGKRITSGFSYLGPEAAIAWAKACRDPLYPVMKTSIESFGQRWCCIRAGLDPGPYHYVSLGPGDGQKDAVILYDLRRDNPNLCYVAVDMSAEMLRLGTHDLIRNLKMSRSQILPVQLDFSAEDNLAELARLLRGLFGDEPVLFSLLGNTMANFENDVELLGMLATLLRPQDRLMLEVATTDRVDDAHAQEAAEEYEGSRTFREFVTSALMHYTDLHIDMDSVFFHGVAEKGRALLIKIIYRSQLDHKIRITLPDRADVAFNRNDTILLYVTRKYARDNIDVLLSESGVQRRYSTHSAFTTSRRRTGFGMELLMLTADPAASARGSLMEDLWRKEHI